MALKTKYSNEDSRFKIDERFVEDESDTEKQEETSKPSTKEQLRSENLSSMKILESITGKQLIRPQQRDPNKESSSNAKKSTINKIVRYDPNKNDHKIYELNDNSSDDDEQSAESSSSAPESSSDEDEDSSKKPKSEKKASEKKPDTNQNKKIEEDLTKFYKIEPNLKELFSSNDVFKFKFDNIEEKSEQESNYFPEPHPTSLLAKSGKYSFLDEINFNNRNSKKDKHFNSSESEDESSQSEEEEKSEKKKEAPVQNQTRHINNSRTADSRSNVVTTFLPDFENDKQLKDAIDYFKRKETVEELKTEWMKSRELLVKVKQILIILIIRSLFNLTKFEGVQKEAQAYA